ncbi:MAG: group 1 truncated hemoglobin [Akkermansiaceae bacterium]
MEDKKTIYERIGGEAAVEGLVHEFYERVLADEVLAPFFKHVDTSKLKAMQKEFFSEALGGPLFYSGRSMREVHAGKGIKKSHLALFTGHLMATLEDHQEQLALTRLDIDSIYSRVALEADEISGGGSEAG